MALILQTIGDNFSFEEKTMEALMKEAHEEVGARWRMLDVPWVPIMKLTRICQRANRRLHCAGFDCLPHYVVPGPSHAHIHTLKHGANDLHGQKISPLASQRPQYFWRPSNT